MQSRYDDAEANEFLRRYGARWGRELALRVYTSQLLGRDGALVLHGGGNTSVKGRATELTGEEVDVLWVKGSGWDLGSIEPEGFPACRLAPFLRACQLESLSDDDMVKLLRSQMLDPSSPTPSVEALLHAFVPARYVDHTHADAVLAVVDQPDAAARSKEVWGDGAVFVPYIMPGFVLARRVAELGSALGGVHVMVLDKHGIFTWGDSAQQSYERMIEAVTLAERYVAERRTTVSAEPAPELDASERRRRQRELSPLVRGALGRAADGQRMLLAWRDDPEILSLLRRPEAKRWTSVGTVTPDHVIRTKPVPLFFEPAAPADLPEALDEAIAGYARAYAAYFERGARARGGKLVRLDRLPRVLVVPGLGALTLGKTHAEARVAGDIYAHTARVILDALAVGEYRPVGELDLFDVEYWSLEQAKLRRGASSPAPLERHIALVTGAASGIGKATAKELLRLGAHVMLADRDGEGLERTRAELAQKSGPRVVAQLADVSSDDDIAALVAAVVEAFGGLDVLVSNAGAAPSGLLHTREGDERLRASLEINLLAHQRASRACVEVLLAQGLGGCLLYNASKSAFNQGPEFGPYAVPKAALVALMRQYAVDLGRHGIRANAVNADRIRTGLFGGGVLEARAKARGISPDDYFRDNLLRRETTAEDVARVFGWLASAGATTGAVVTVDGGNAAAFVR
jgi:rhamnose utilization protein RhaD (predicted bifunctional aldolase and dehydrogenase)/NAD(P)-dependent dehydrogenase (short-subunit alcohol dehydrogenase family)